MTSSHVKSNIKLQKNPDTKDMKKHPKALKELTVCHRQTWNMSLFSKDRKILQTDTTNNGCK